MTKKHLSYTNTSHSWYMDGNTYTLPVIPDGDTLTININIG